MNLSSSHSSASKPSYKKPLGQILNEAGLISAKQIEIALQEQAEISNMKIGEIFALRGWIKQETADFFAEQWEQVLQQEQKRPLVYYLRKAALLDETQINLILSHREQSKDKVRFHHLAVQRGFIQQQTVDFLVKNLISPSKSRKNAATTSAGSSYKILQSYIRGETNFQRSELKKIKLNHVTLKGVNLDSSNFTGAELKQVNFSNSSLRLTNLTGANLEKAVLREVDFECAYLAQTNLTDAHLEGANFKKANLKEADLRGGYFASVCFQGADLRGAKLRGANLTGATYDAETTFDPEFDPAKMGMKLI
jgi:uncharacterized protein YjbI with pentapeptide repeats